MRIETIYEMTSPCRDNFRIKGYRFGEGEKTIAIVGAMRGDEFQQQYICSQLIRRLAKLESDGGIAKNCGVLVIPSCNPFSMNVDRRFWAMDNTDINRMFPGYAKGETTQRIADAIFNALNGFKFGIQLASYYVPGNFITHVRMLATGYEDVETAMLFGMKYVTTYVPKPFDTTLLNYNWQLWNTKAFSIYAGQTNSIDPKTCDDTIDAIMRMMNKTGIISRRIPSVAYESVILDEGMLQHVKAQRAGIFIPLAHVGKRVSIGDSLAHVIDPYSGQVIDDVKSNTDGTVFFAYNRPVAFQNALLFLIHALEQG